MQAQVFEILSRERSQLFQIAGIQDFKLAEQGWIDAGDILDNPNISLYCLDPQTRQAVFVEVADLAAVLAAPFYYLGQYQHALRVLKVSYETLAELAEQVLLDDRKLILVYSMGRCGTTVTSTAFAQIESVVSLSEPDVFTQLVQLRDFSGAQDAEISALTWACMRLTCKDQGTAHPPIWAIKFRSFVMELADLIYAHFPQAKCLFLYRHPVPWSKSMARAFGGESAPSKEQLLGFWMWTTQVSSRLERYPLNGQEEISIGLLTSQMWLGYMERCLERIQAGQAILPLRYEDLKAQPELVIHKMFAYCGLGNAKIKDLAAALGRDSQADSPISQEQLKQVQWEIDPQDIAEILTLISEHPTINTPDYRLPDGGDWAG